jgi:ribosome-associated translation inhibitor RaiA
MQLHVAEVDVPAPQITFHGLTHSPRLETEILERAVWLETFYQGIMSCRVVIEVPHRHQRQGRRFHVTIELIVPNGEAIVIRHESTQHGALNDAATSEAIHEAFDAARRRLQDFARRQRGAVKTHATQ